jgi:hypothetical protein
MMLDTANGNLSIGGALQRNPASPVTVIDANGNGVFNTVTAGASTSQYLVGSAVQIFDHDFYTTRTDGLALQFRFGRGTNSNGTLYTRWYKGDGSVNQAASLNHSNGVFNTNGGLTIADIPIVDASRNATFNRLTCSLLGLPASNATPADNDIWVENGKLAVRIAGVTKYATLT